MPAQGARSLVGYIAETAWGTTPPTPQLTALRHTAFGINLTKESFEDNSIQGDRLQRFSIHGNKTVAGDIDVNLSHTTYDEFLESALNGTWAANVLKVGTTRKSFTIEDGAPDINVYRQFTGCVVNTCAISVPVSGLVTAKFGFIGKNLTVAGTTLDASGGLTEPPARQPFTHLGGTLLEGGSSIAILTGIEVNIDNELAGNFALGSDTIVGTSAGFTKVTGTLTAYFASSALLNKFLNGAESSLSFTLTDGANTLQVSLPRIKYNGGTVNRQGQGATTIELPFVALRDATAASNIVITRSA